MQLTPNQIRSSCRAHVVATQAADGSIDALLEAMCRRLALLPDVRWAKVEGARARLLATGPPSAEVLADMLVDELRLATPR